MRRHTRQRPLALRERLGAASALLAIAALTAPTLAGCVTQVGTAGAGVAATDAGGDGLVDTGQAGEADSSETDSGAAPDLSTTAGNLPPGPLVELKANKDYLGAALAVIQTAKQQIDITEFETTSTGTYLSILTGALKSAHGRGVAIRVLMDDEIANNQAVIADLKAAGIDAKLDGSKSVRTHVKLIRSEQGFVVGSTNWSQASMQYNNETNFLVRDATANATMAGYFDALWQKPSAMKKVATGSDPNVAVYSDGGYKGVVQPLIQNAKSRIILCTYAMNVDDSDVKNVLADVQAAAKRGVQVRALLDVSNYTDGADPSINSDAGIYLKSLGVSVRNDTPDVTTHAKFLVVDDTVVLGSNNWGHGGFFSYHEAGVKTRLPEAVNAVVAYFEKLWSSAKAI